MTFNAQQVAYIKSRDKNNCQFRCKGCTNTAEYIQLRYPQAQLRAVGRDIDSPDNSACACSNCVTPAPQPL